MKLNYLIIFVSLVLIDIVYIFYLKYVAQNKINKASAWASVVTLLNGIIIINYSSDIYSVLSAMIGAYVGTFISMKFFNKD
jgi:xanthine/uracil permease